MKKWLLGGLLVLAVLYSGRGQDVARLQPVEVLRIGMDGENFVVEVDTGERGAGASLADAVEDLQESASAVVFLDTAEYALIQDGCDVGAESLLQFLRPSCMVCYEAGTADLTKVGDFFRVHRPGVTLLECWTGTGVPPQLEIRDGRMEFAT